REGEGPAAGNSRIRSPISILESRSILSRPICRVGVGASKPLREMRELETTTVSKSLSCANAEAQEKNAAVNIVPHIKFQIRTQHPLAWAGDGSRSRTVEEVETRRNFRHCSQ